MAVSLRFRSVCEEDLDEAWTTSRFILKQLDYSLSISMRDSWLGLRPRQLSRDRDKRVRQKRPLKNYLLTCNCWYLRRVHGPFHKRLLILVALKILVLRTCINSENCLKQEVKVTQQGTGVEWRRKNRDISAGRIKWYLWHSIGPPLICVIKEEIRLITDSLK